MADILASISVVLGAETSGFKAAMADARKELKGLAEFGEGLKTTGAALSKYVTLPILGIGGAAVKMAGDMEKAQASFTTMLGSASAATDTLKDLKTFAADTPFEFPEIQDAAKKLLAFNTPAKELKETLRQLGDISAGIDAPIGEIAELFGKARVQGRLFQEDINQLTGRGIPIIQELAKQFNVTEAGVRKLVESGKVNFGNLQTAFANLTKEGGKFGGLMEKQSQTLPGLFSTLTDNVGQALADLGADLVTSLNLKEVLGQVSTFVKNIADAFRSLSPETKSSIIALAAFAAATGPVLYALGTLGTSLVSLRAGFKVLGIEAAADLAPILPVAIAVAGAAYLIYKNWDSITAYFTTGEGGKVFGDLAASVSQSINDIKAAFNSLSGVGGDSFGDLLSASGLLKGAIREIAVGLKAISDVVGGTIGAVTKLFQRDFVGAAEDAKRAIYGLVDPIANVLGFTKKVSFSEFFQLGEAAHQAGDEVDYFGDQVTATAAKLAVLGGLSEAQQKALDSLRKSLLDNANNSRALGTEYDYIGGKAKILESGIKSLIGVGFAPLGATVQGLRTELNGLAVQVDQMAPRIAAGLEKMGETPEFKLKLPSLDAGKPPEVLSMVVDEPQLPDYQAIFGGAARSVLAGSQQLSEAQLTVLDSQRAFNTNMGELTEQLNTSAGPLLAGFAVQFGDAFGSIVTGASSAGDALASLFGGILQSIGGFMSQFGQQLIVIGIGKQVLDTLFTAPGTGPLAIAAGVGLIALAGVVSAAGKSAASSLGSIGAGGSASTTPNITNYGQNSSTQKIVVVAEFKLKGQDLVAIGRSQTFRSKVTD